MSPRMCAVVGALWLGIAACSSNDTEATRGPAGSATLPQSRTVNAVRLPLMRPLPSREPIAGDRPVTVRVRVVFAGTAPMDTTVQARSFAPECGASFVDTAVVRNGSAVADAIVWVEGATALRAESVTEYRPTIQLDLCRLRPRVQLASLGSTLLLVMRDSLAQSLVVVPSSPSAPVDTVPFMMAGQLIPVQHRADSSGVLAVFATGLPWARAYVGIAPPATSALSDAAGTAQFTLDGRATRATLRAWHPSLGEAAATVSFSAAKSAYELTLTFKR